MKKFLTFLCTVTLVFGVMGSANALSIYGTVWQGIQDGNNVVRYFDTTQTPTTSFRIDGEYNFSSTVAGATYDDFLGGIGGTNTVTWLGTDIGAQAMDTASGFNGSFFQFTGSAYFDANENVRHDDGIWIAMTSLLDSSVYEAGYANPTSPRNTDLGNAAGNYAYVLNYIESNQLPAVLQMDVAPVPEPATMLLLGTGLVGLAAFGRKKFLKK